MPFNYQHAKIYCIICNVTGLKYIGSTCRSLSERLTDHKTHLKKNKTKTAAWLVMEHNNCFIFLIQDFPCNDKQELLEREKYYIENAVCVNKIEDKSQAKNKDYYLKNIEKIRAQQSKYYFARKNLSKQIIENKID